MKSAVLLADALKALEKQGVLRIGGDEEARARGDGEAFDRGAVHQAGTLELLAEVSLAVAGKPAQKLLVAESQSGPKPVRG